MKLLPIKIEKSKKKKKPGWGSMYRCKILPKKKSEGGMGGMTTTGSGAGVVTTGQGSYPGFRKKKRKRALKKLEIEKKK